MNINFYHVIRYIIFLFSDTLSLHFSLNTIFLCILDSA